MNDRVPRIEPAQQDSGWKVPPQQVAAAASIVLVGGLAAMVLSPQSCIFLVPALVPLSILLFLSVELSSAKQGYTAGLISLALIALVPMVHWSRLPGMALGFSWAACFAGVMALRSARGLLARLEQQIADCRRQTAEDSEAFKNATQQKHFYLRRTAHLKSQIWMRQSLYAFAREIGTLLDPETIKQKLLEKVMACFPNEKVVFQAQAFSGHPVDRWVAEKKTSFLLKDVSDEKALSILSNLLQEEIKLSNLKSVVAVPLVIERQLMGLIRLESETSNRFLEVDLQQLELYAHLSTLALENAQLFARVNALAAKDGLTGLATHRVFQERIAEEINRAARYHKTMALAIIDIDHFKQVNDNYGHLAGDQVLKTLARMLQAQCRPVDFAARYGGEEFCLIFPEIDSAQAVAFLEGLRSRVAGQLISVLGQTLRVTVSIGCATFPDDAQTATQLIRTADQRLYRAKAEGRNRVVQQ